MTRCVEDDYQNANLADYWVYKTDVSESDVAGIHALPYVEHAQRRKLLEVGLSGGSDGTLRIHAIEGRPEVNIPNLVEGQLLDGTETKSLLLDSRFAGANGLEPGDTVQVSMGEQPEGWLIKVLYVAQNTFITRRMACLCLTTKNMASRIRMLPLCQTFLIMSCFFPWFGIPGVLIGKY